MSEKKEPPFTLSIVRDPLYGGISVPADSLSIEELTGLAVMMKLDHAYRVMDDMSPETRKQVLNSYCAKCGRSKLQTVTDLRTSMFRMLAQCNCEG